MKLRQKLAMVLATAMVVTAVPVTTMAASKNNVTKTLTVQKDQKIGAWEVTTAAGTNGTVVNTATGVSVVDLRIDAVDGLKRHDEFYLTLENAKWEAKEVVESYLNNDDVLKDKFKFTRVNDKELKVQVLVDSTEIRIPLLAIATGGNASVTVIPEQTTLTKDTFVFAVTPEAGVKGNVTVNATLPAFYTEGNIASITVEEVAPNAFSSMKPNENYLEVTLENSDFYFTNEGGTLQSMTINGQNVKVYEKEIKQVGSRGASFSGERNLTAYVDEDEQVMYIPVDTTSTRSRAVIEYKGITIKADTRTPQVGSVEVDITGKNFAKIDNQKVATIAEYGTTLNVKDDKAVEIKAGQSGKVTFTLAEIVEDSMSNGSSRTVEFRLDQGHFGHATLDRDGNVVKPEVTIGKIKNGKVDVTAAVKESLEVIYDKDNNAVGFEVRLNATDKLDAFTFEDVVVHAPIDAKGTMTLTAEGRAIGEELTEEIVTVKEVLTVDAKPMTLKVGLKEQVGGALVLAEEEAGMFKKGETIVINVEDERDFTFNKKPVVEVEGDLQIGDVTLDGGKLTIEIKRASRSEASAITIKDFNVKVDRTVPEGTYDINVSGKAFTECGSIDVKDFFVVGTPNTEDIVGQEKAIVSTFKIGETSYTVNGETFEMSAAAFMSTTNRTMVPVRFLANAFGVKDQDIIFANGSATMILGNRTIQVTNGSDVALLNGVPVKMDTPIIIKGDRAYGSASQIGALLGIKAEWSAETQTATFTNNLK